MIDYKYEELFRKDSVDKQLYFDFGDVMVTNEDIFEENLEINESLCSDSELRFGTCEASILKTKIANVVSPRIGKQFVLYVTLDGNTDTPFTIGTYKVESDNLTADRMWREITAYDRMYDIINAEMSDWYNSLLPNADSTVTLKEFRDGFFEYFGIEQEEVALVNDNMIVEQTISPSQLPGREVITAICEINGCLGHITRDGKFCYIFLEKSHSDRGTEIAQNGKYISCTYEDYECKSIDKLQIRKEENDIGVIVGDGDNTCIIQDNFLVYGKGTEALTPIAENVLSIIQGCVYRPFTAEMRGNPCVEVGDAVVMHTKYADISSYVLQRTLKGIQSLKDTFATEGVETYSEKVNSITKSIIELKGRTNVLERSVEGTKSTVTLLDEKFYRDLTALDEKTQEGLENYLTQAGLDTDTKLKDYITMEESQSIIDQTAANITQTLQSTFVTQVDVADTLGGYSTTEQVNSIIDQRAQGIEESVSSQITEKMGDYSTIEQMNSALDIKADEITQTVARQFEITNDTVSGLDTRLETAETTVKITADSLGTKVDKGTVSSEISQEPGLISISSNRFELESDNLEITKDGKLIVKENGIIEGSVIKGTQIEGSEITGGTIYGTQIESSKFISEKTNGYGRLVINGGTITGYYLPYSSNDGYPKTSLYPSGDFYPLSEPRSSEAGRILFDEPMNNNACMTIRSDNYAFATNNIWVSKDGPNSHQFTSAVANRDVKYCVDSSSGLHSVLKIRNGFIVAT